MTCYLCTGKQHGVPAGGPAGLDDNEPKSRTYYRRMVSEDTRAIISAFSPIVVMMRAMCSIINRCELRSMRSRSPMRVTGYLRASRHSLRGPRKSAGGGKTPDTPPNDLCWRMRRALSCSSACHAGFLSLSSCCYHVEGTSRPSLENQTFAILGRCLTEGRLLSPSDVHQRSIGM